MMLYGCSIFHVLNTCNVGGCLIEDLDALLSLELIFAWETKPRVFSQEVLIASNDSNDGKTFNERVQQVMWSFLRPASDVCCFP